MNLSRIYRKFLGGAGLKRLLTGSGQEFQNDILVILDRLFYIGDVNVFVRLMGKLRVARAKNHHRHKSLTKCGQMQEKTNIYEFAGFNELL